MLLYFEYNVKDCNDQKHIKFLLNDFNQFDLSSFYDKMKRLGFFARAVLFYEDDRIQSYITTGNGNLFMTYHD